MLPFSLVRHANGLVFLAGQLPIVQDGPMPEGIEAQTDVTLDRIENILKGEGLDLSDVISVTAYLTDPADFAAFNKAYERRFPEPYPVRTTVRTDLMLPGARLELTAIAQARS